jgi:exosortase E/protease (VPEID-CTERM system)
VSVVSSSEEALAVARRGVGLFARTAVVVGVLLLEKAFLNLFVDFARAQTAEGLGAVVRITQHAVFRFLVSFAIAAALFGFLRAGGELRDADATARAAPPLRVRWLLVHLLLVVPLVPLSSSLYGHAMSVPLAPVVTLWLLFACLAAAALFAALAPWALWKKAARALGNVWWYGAVAAAGAALAMTWSQKLWTGAARVTFEAVQWLLGWVVPTLETDPAHLTIDTGRFGVSIDPVCSGLEGLGLMLAFSTVLLLLFRREFLFPRALLIVPAGLVLIFALNIVRIAALVLIGNAGYESVAVYGFHSQAGWLAFNGAAVGVAVVSARSRWLSRAARDHMATIADDNPTAVYLLPYLVLLLAGMVSHAASAGFEDLYWLRLLAAAVLLGYSWPRLRGVDWRFSWRGVLAGAAAFVLCIAAARLTLSPAGVPAALVALPPISRNAWLIGHILVSVLLAPIVEELAFRGYLLRRVGAVQFESASPRLAGAVGLIVSSLLFGLCQGASWPMGIMAGLVFGLVYMRTQRLGEAVAAHVTVNALIAVAVLAGSQWQLW